VTIDGTICITASEVFAAWILPPVVATIRARHPGIDIEIVASNKTSNLHRREADIAVRSFRPTEPELVARKVQDGFARLYASPAYLERIGDPSTPEELSRADFIGFDRSDLVIEGLNARGLRLTQQSFPIVTENQLVQWELAKQGMGVCIMMEQVGDAEPRMRRALHDFPPIEVPTWLVSHRDVRTSRRVRVVFDLLAAALSGHEEAPEAA
jgi:DNA-binding transcriptional LysR family regulator